MRQKSRIFLIRHLATKLNDRQIIMGKKINANILNDKRADMFLKNIIKLSESYSFNQENSVFISSPLARCRQTISLLRQGALRINKKIEVLEEFIETDMGHFSGKSVAEIRKEYGSNIDDWMFRPEDFTFPGGESYVEVKKRTKLGVKKLITNYSDYKNIFVSTHVDIIKMILSNVLGFPFNQRRRLNITNGSISLLSLLDNLSLRVEAINLLS